ncbi:MAG: exodeoxyribonuclease VII small subunit [Omnitrophica bacterium RIFCSPLOWO2_12_FULL_50_11]|nr:MAG: exodeoxyribonuclease VII small subunit [Omnitrophica bacterium RIFCSPLOWO2_12_FULL_50_11]
MEQEIKFEKALERLEKIVEDLESGNMPLEDALKKYEEGVRLSRDCSKKLEQAQTKIEELTRTLNSALEPESADRENSLRKGGPKKPKKVQPSFEQTDDNLLL